jgi:hypothetical protein
MYLNLSPGRADMQIGNESPVSAVLEPRSGTTCGLETNLESQLSEPQCVSWRFVSKLRAGAVIGRQGRRRRQLYKWKDQHFYGMETNLNNSAYILRSKRYNMRCFQLARADMTNNDSAVKMGRRQVTVSIHSTTVGSSTYLAPTLKVSRFKSRPLEKSPAHDQPSTFNARSKKSHDHVGA